MQHLKHNISHPTKKHKKNIRKREENALNIL